MIYPTGIIIQSCKKMDNNYLFFEIVLGELFFTEIQNATILYMTHTNNFFMNNWELLITSTAGQTMTVINNPCSYSVSQLSHAVKSDVPAPQLPIV